VRVRSVKRLRERTTLFGALLGVVAIVSGLGVSLIGYLAYAETQGTRVELASRTGSDSGLEISLPRDEDWQTQDERIRELLALRFTQDGRSVPIGIDRTVESSENVKIVLPDDLPTPSGAGSAVVLSVPQLDERAGIVDGTWPAAANEVSVQADAAEALGLAPGTRFTLGAAEMTVTGTWRALDPFDPRWLGDERVVEGFEGVSYGPIVIAEDAWAAVDPSPRARWTMTPVVAQMRASDLAGIRGAWSGMRNYLRDAGVDTSSFDDRGRLVRTALIVQQRVDALRAVEPVALLIVSAIAIVTVIELARLLCALRAAELRLMWSRGATARGLAGSAAAETGIVAGTGALLGAAVAVPLLMLIGGPEAVTGTGAALWVLPLTATIAAAAITAGATLATTRAYSRHDRPDEAGRVRRAAGPGAIVLVTAAAALSTWQLLLYGSPVTPTSGAGSQVDPVAVVAPALALLSLVLLVLLALPLAAPLTERAARRSTGVTRALVTRTLIRRLGIATTPLVVIGLAVGQVVIAAGYAQTWDDSYTVTSQLGAGSALRLAASPGDLTGARVQSVVDGENVTAIAPVFQDTVVIGLDSAALLGVAPSAVRDLATGASGRFDSALAAESITGAEPLALPEDASGVRASVRTRGLADEPALAVLLSDEYGALRTVAMDEQYTATLPTLDPGVPGTWRITGFDVTLPAGALGDIDQQHPPLVEITGLATANGTALHLGESWSAVSLGAVPYPMEATPTGPGAVLADGIQKLRLLPALPALPSVVISQTLADRNSIAVDDVLFLPVDPRMENLQLAVAAIVPTIPGAQSDAAVLIDLALVQAVQQRAYETIATPRLAWVEAVDDAAAIPMLRDGLPAGVRVQSLVVDPSRGILQSGSIALWIGAAGAVLLAVVAVAAVIGAQLRARRPEALVLHALGLDARAIAALRRRELAAALGAGVVIGILAGLAVTLLTVAALARAAVPDPYPSVPTTVALSTGPVLGAILGVGILLLALVAAYGRGVAAQVRRGSNSEATR